MGCLLSRPNPEVLMLLSKVECFNEEKSQLLFNLHNTKISKHLNAKPLDLKLRNDSSITKDFLDSKLAFITNSIRSLQEAPAVQDPEFSEIFDSMESMLEHEFYEDLKTSLKTSESLVNSLRQKAKELNYIHEDLERENLTMDDLEIRRQETDQEIKDLKVKQMELEEKIREARDYMENLKRRKRRFTVTALPPSKTQLRSKAILRSELIKKIEGIKAEQARYTQRLEEMQSRPDEDSDFNFIKSSTRRIISFKEPAQQEPFEVDRKAQARRRMTYFKPAK